MINALKNKVLTPEEQAIINCENIDLEHIGSIQNSGFLIATNILDYSVTYASENCNSLFKIDINRILNSSLLELTSKNFVHKCNNILAHNSISIQREFIQHIELENNYYNTYGYLSGENFIIEFFKASSTNSPNIKTLDHLQRLLQTITNCDNTAALLSILTDEFRMLTNFDRVKAYMFLPDDSGEVIAESKVPYVPSYLGLRFPSFDIPKSAKQLYKKNSLRIIYNVNAKSVPLKSFNSEPLDLSLSVLRAVAPVHLQYLTNMKVNTSLSVPIIVNNTMYGLFAFHNTEVLQLDSEKLTLLEIIGKAVSSKIESLLQTEAINNLKRCTKVISPLFSPDESILGFSSYWSTVEKEISTLITSDGVALLSNNAYSTYGITPKEDTIRQLSPIITLDFHKDSDQTKPIIIESLKESYPELNFEDISGLIAIPIVAPSYSFLFYFRKSSSDQVKWAGKPQKSISNTKEGFKLNPRASFNSYIEDNKFRSDPFTNKDVKIAETIFEVVKRNIDTIKIQNIHRERIGLVIRELNHRVRNTLAIVASIISQSYDKNKPTEEFIKSLENRIQNLSETQKLLTHNQWQPVSIETLFKSALSPFQSYFKTRIFITGETNLALETDLASLLALIIYELASNASKYGALSNDSGSVELQCSYKNNILSIIWKEQNGPIVSKPNNRGFGTSLITEAINYEFNGTASLEFYKTGVIAKFSLPIKLKNHSEVIDTDIPKPKNTEKRPLTILVLEDDYMVAKETQNNITKTGNHSVDLVSTIHQAIETLKIKHYDFAFLDANIRGEFSGDVAKLLKEIDIPFAYITGYGDADNLIQQTDCIAILTKPITTKQLQDTLNLVDF